MMRISGFSLWKSATMSSTILVMGPPTATG
ncbi:Uncharacterised protein [Bordetella pertussis]|nr:Uncharacterised protein [Bordetella pertussis]CFP62840.1 Uncharacterised protein [Bordetella pertussis]